MELNYNCTGESRKRLVTAISEITGVPAKYLGAPSFAYQVDYFTIDRNGGVTFDDRVDSEEIENLIETLDSQGFTAEPQEVEASEDAELSPAEVDGLCISMPASLFSETALQNLKDITAAKGNLIRKALGVEEWNDTIKPYTQGDIMKLRKGVVDGTEIYRRIQGRCAEAGRRNGGQCSL